MIFLGQTENDSISAWERRLDIDQLILESFQGASVLDKTPALSQPPWLMENAGAFLTSRRKPVSNIPQTGFYRVISIKLSRL